jgi:hypothetical protein
MNPTEKPFHKGSSIFGIIIALAFIAMSYNLYFNIAEQPNTANPTLVKIAGGAGMIFFGGLLIVATIKKVKQSVNK